MLKKGRGLHNAHWGLSLSGGAFLVIAAYHGLFDTEGMSHARCRQAV